jgi:hypothetical protein
MEHFVMNRHGKGDPWHGREITFWPQTDSKAKIAQQSFYHETFPGWRPDEYTQILLLLKLFDLVFNPILLSLDDIHLPIPTSQMLSFSYALSSPCVFQIPERKSWALVFICISSTHTQKNALLLLPLDNICSLAFTCSFMQFWDRLQNPLLQSKLHSTRHGERWGGMEQK